MAVFKPKVQRGINTDLEVLAGDQYRDTRTLGQQIATYLFGLRGAKFGFLMLGALAFLQPGMADLISLLGLRSEEHTSELQSLMRISYAVFCLNKQISFSPLLHHSL